jgi:hypothetical protein
MLPLEERLLGVFSECRPRRGEGGRQRLEKEEKFLPPQHFVAIKKSATE